jgi:hypothetical protein
MHAWHRLKPTCVEWGLECDAMIWGPVESLLTTRLHSKSSTRNFCIYNPSEMDLMRLVPGREPTAGEKLEEQFDNLCPSLSWTQRMIGFGITAGEYFFPRSSTLFELELASLQVVLQVSVFSSLLLASFSSAS